MGQFDTKWLKRAGEMADLCGTRTCTGVKVERVVLASSADVRLHRSFSHLKQIYSHSMRNFN